MSLIWPSQRIAASLADGTIAAERPHEADRLQPASLDLRLGHVAYRLPASFLPGPGRRVADRLAELSTHEVDLTRPTVLERSCVHIVPLMERLALPPGVAARANAKARWAGSTFSCASSATAAPPSTRSPRATKGRSTPRWCRARSRSSRRPARAWRSCASARARRSPGASCRSPSTSTPQASRTAVVGYRARKTSGLIDMARIGAYPRDAYWEPLTPRPGQRDLVLDPDEFYILASAEAVVVGAAEAAEMVAYDTSVGELRSHYAGFLDPGFGLDAAWTPRQDHGPRVFAATKLFFVCELVGRAARPSLETSEVAWFAEDALPADLSTARTLPGQLARMFVHAREPALPTEFD